MPRLLIFTLLLFTIACTPGSRQDNINASDESPKTIKLQLNPQIGKKYKYLVTSETESSQEIGGEEIKNNSNVEMNVEYLFQRDSMKNLLVDLTYTKFSLHVKMGEIEKELNAATAATSFDPSEKMFAAFNNANLYAVVDTLGNVLSLRGIDVIKGKMRQLAAGNANATDMLNSTMQQYLGEEFFRQTIEKSFKMLSDKPLSAGDTISQTNTLNAGFPITVQTIYKVDAIKNNMAEIVSDAAINMKEQQMTVEGSDVLATLKGDQTGKIEMDAVTGILKSSDSDFKLKGNLQVAGNNVPVKIRVRNKVLLVN